MQISILPQPDDNTCGPTCLHAIYQYFGEEISLEQVIQQTSFLKNGGTLAVLLGIDALKKGYQSTLFSYNLKVFDPTWEHLSSDEILIKLEEQIKYKSGVRFTTASLAYTKYLQMGGKLRFDMLTDELLKSYFDKEQPILTGLSATYLYQSARERDKGQYSVYDDVRGEPSGHFVVLYGFDADGNIKVADPYAKNPISNRNYYSAHPNRLINSIHLGIMTYDANILVIEKNSK